MIPVKVVLSRDTYESVKTMLESPDKENQVVGITCIENSDFKMNIAYILLLVHETNIVPSMWKDHAPETSKMYSTLLKADISGATTTYIEILKLMAQYEVEQEDYQFFMTRYSTHLTKVINTNIKAGWNRIIDSRELRTPVVNSLNINVNFNT